MKEAFIALWLICLMPLVFSMTREVLLAVMRIVVSVAQQRAMRRRHG